MEFEQEKELLLKSVGIQKEFKIIQGPPLGILGVLVFDSANEVRGSGVGVVFGIVIENELGQGGFRYLISPRNINDHKKGPFAIKDGYMTFPGIIVELDDENPALKEEKYKVLPVGTEVVVIYNDETYDGTIILAENYVPPKEVEYKEALENKEEVPKTLKEVLQNKAEHFRKEWNKKSHDWIFNESELFVESEKILIVAFCREYSVHFDENAYSMVYVFSESSEGERIYYDKFWDAHPEWRDAKLFIKTLISAEKKGGELVISAKAEDGAPKRLTYSLS